MFKSGNLISSTAKKVIPTPTMNHFYAYFTAFRSLKSTLSIFATRLTLTMKYRLRLQNAIYPFTHKFLIPRRGIEK